LYPESILQPSLRKWQTRAFQTLVTNTQSSRKLAPADAEQQATGYVQYFHDICTLRIEASCTSKTLTPSGYRSLFYMFGRGGISAKVFWSRYDNEDSSGYAQ